MVFRPRRHPLFFVDIVVDSQDVRYSTPLQNFETVLVSLFDKGIQACQNVPQLEKVCVLACSVLIIEMRRYQIFTISTISASASVPVAANKLGD